MSDEVSREELEARVREFEEMALVSWEAEKHRAKDNAARKVADPEGYAKLIESHARNLLGRLATADPDLFPDVLSRLEELARKAVEQRERQMEDIQARLADSE